jgi:hypothetical protein
MRHVRCVLGCETIVYDVSEEHALASLPVSTLAYIRTTFSNLSLLWLLPFFTLRMAQHFPAKCQWFAWSLFSVTTASGYSSSRVLLEGMGSTFFGGRNVFYCTFASCRTLLFHFHISFPSLCVLLMFLKTLLVFSTLCCFLTLNFKITQHVSAQFGHLQVLILVSFFWFLFVMLVRPFCFLCVPVLCCCLACL